MQLDLATLLWVILTATASLSLAVLWVAWPMPAREGLRVWAGSLLLATLAFGVLTLRDALGWQVPYALPSTLVSAALAAQLHAVLGMDETASADRVRRLTLGPVAAVLLLAVVLQQAPAVRVTLVSSLFALQSGLLAWQAWGRNDAASGGRERSRWLLAAGALALLVVFAARAVVSLATGPVAANQPFSPLVQTLTYLVTLAVVLLNTVAFALVHMERAFLRMREQATLDPLTGVPNRRALLDNAQRMLALARRMGKPVGVLMVDIDHFKVVNDTHGHVAGDSVLREVAQLIHRRLRAYDTMGRFGGEEFVVMLADSDAGSALVVAEDIRSAVERLAVSHGSAEIRVTISVGVHARVPEGEIDGLAEAMTGAADRALYAAKAAGRNRTEIET